MQRKANRLLLLLIGTALAACSSTSEQGSSGTETEPEIVPSTVQPPPPELEPIQYTEAELDVGDLGPVEYSDETVTYDEAVSADVDSGISAPEEFPEEQLEFPVTTYEIPEDDEIGDLGSIDTPTETITYTEEYVPDAGTGVSDAQAFDEEEITDLGPAHYFQSPFRGIGLGFMTAGDFRDPAPFLAGMGSILTGALVARRVPGNLLWGMLLTAVLAWTFDPRYPWPTAMVSTPPSTISARIP